MSSGRYYVFHCERCNHRFVVPLPRPPPSDPCDHCGHTIQITSIDDDEFNERYPYVTLSPQDLPLSHDTLRFLDTFPEPQEISDCVICMGSLDAEADQGLKVARCRHIFHRVCLGQHLDNSIGNCPVCRDPVLPGENNENPQGNAEGDEDTAPEEGDKDDEGLNKRD